MVVMHFFYLTSKRYLVNNVFHLLLVRLVNVILYFLNLKYNIAENHFLFVRLFYFTIFYFKFIILKRLRNIFLLHFSCEACEGLALWFESLWIPISLKIPVCLTQTSLKIALVPTTVTKGWSLHYFGFLSKKISR